MSIPVQLQIVGIPLASSVVSLGLVLERVVVLLLVIRRNEHSQEDYDVLH